MIDIIIISKVNFKEEQNQSLKNRLVNFWDGWIVGKFYRAMKL